MRRRSKGQALAEFALVLPIFLVIVFGIIDVGRFVHSANTLSNAVREAARVGAVGARPAECESLSRQACVERVVRDRAWGVAGAIETTVRCDRVALGGGISGVDPSACRTGDLLTVHSEVPFAPATPILGQLMNEITVTGDTQVTVNQ
jgi:hypothetical protein